MNLDELIQALIDLKESGKAIDKLPVVFITKKGNHKSIDRIKVKADQVSCNKNYISLITLD
jgi:hypothetical protein